MKYLTSSALIILLLIMSCADKPNKNEIIEKSSYFDYSKSNDQNTGGIKMIPIKTPKGTFNVYTKRMGNNPKMRVLLLHEDREELMRNLEILTAICQMRK